MRFLACPLIVVMIVPIKVFSEEASRSIRHYDDLQRLPRYELQIRRAPEETRIRRARNDPQLRRALDELSESELESEMTLESREIELQGRALPENDPQRTQSQEECAERVVRLEVMLAELKARTEWLEETVAKQREVIDIYGQLVNNTGTELANPRPEQ